MCLGIAGRIVEIWDEPAMATIATMTEYGVFGDAPSIPIAGGS